jgi:hypothetical protein
LCAARLAVTTATWCVPLVYFRSLPPCFGGNHSVSLPSAVFWLFQFLSADLLGFSFFWRWLRFDLCHGTCHILHDLCLGAFNDPAVLGGSSIYDRSRDRDHTEWHWPSSAEMHGLHREPRQSLMDAVRMAVSSGRAGCCGRGRGSGIFGQGMSLDLCHGPGMALALCLGFRPRHAET